MVMSSTYIAIQLSSVAVISNVLVSVISVSLATTMAMLLAARSTVTRIRPWNVIILKK